MRITDTPGTRVVGHTPVTADPKATEPRSLPSSDSLSTTPEVVVVRSGDTLGKIAARHGISLSQLQELNPELFQEGSDVRGRRRAQNGHWIYPGDQVRLRSASGSSAGSDTMDTVVKAARAAAEGQAAVQATPQATSPAPTVPVAVPVDGVTVSPAPGSAPEGSVNPPVAPDKPAENPLNPPVAPADALHAKQASTPLQTEQVAAPSVAAPPVTPSKGPLDVTWVESPRPQSPEPPKAGSSDSKPLTPPPAPKADGVKLGDRERLILGAVLVGLSLAPVPSKVEAAIGKQAVPGIFEKYPLYTRNPEVTRYVESVGAKVASQASRKDVDWKFYVVDSSAVNAFALPGGHVFVTTGSLKAMKSEAALAGLLGHEIAHVEKRHGVKNIQKTLLAQGIAFAALGDQSTGVQVAAQAAIMLAMNGYSRSNESESDRVGMELAYQAGYDPRGLLEFFETIEHSHDKESPKWMEWLSTHPRTDDRIAQVNRFIEARGATGPMTTNSDEYRRVMAGI